MNTFSTGFLAGTFTLLGTAALAAPVTYGGITFPDGDISFADEVVSATQGSPAATSPNFTDPQETLGAPDYSGGSTGTGSYSLGRGGSIILKFVDNLLTGSGDSGADLHIFEVGPDVEDTFVEISKDGVTFFGIGKVFGSISSIDIDAFGFDETDVFQYVRLTDDPDEGGQSGGTVGADIDAVGAITTVAAPVPLPASALLLLASLGGLVTLRRGRT